MRIKLDKATVDKIHELYMEQETDEHGRELLKEYRKLLDTLLEKLGREHIKPQRSDYGWQAGDRMSEYVLVDDECISIDGQHFWWSEIEESYELELS